MFNLKPYENTATFTWLGKTFKEAAKYKNIPIDRLDETKKILKNSGKKYRIRYRGTRTNPLDMRFRNKRQRYQDCVKQFADRFSVYFI